ncbi:haloalkanoic acid dehalogenase [Trametes versicolor FP-101664 SS1]|uniref:haloalkanoic acid dehalogenase n=1 Tax=Trametes versicolor (strain FP-101664) TaxID=717944 RepID=UPI000462265B|nr:haloalkanoic acid dehalogenase [Trametes versicolor FP-101664 SS1]EIW58493.1 haloalkanoic acid dehalogenase [Trametes versicolor FP-101664 SS1]
MASTNEFSKYKALVFDCYGTLVDWETGIYTSLKPLFEQAGKPADRLAVIDAFSAVERDLQARFPTMRYSALLAKVHATLEARLQDKPTPPETSATSEPVLSSAHKDSGDAQAFAQSVAAWQPFPDTITALATLSKRYKLIILSNIDGDTIAKTRVVLEHGFAFDAVYTAEEVGAYKPAPEMLGFALKRLQEDFGIAQGEVLMTAQSVFHDIIPARGRGMDTAWINRAGAVTGLEGVKGDEAKYVFPTLGDLADAVEKGGA